MAAIEDILLRKGSFEEGGLEGVSNEKAAIASAA